MSIADMTTQELGRLLSAADQLKRGITLPTRVGGVGTIKKKRTKLTGRAAQQTG